MRGESTSLYLDRYSFSGSTYSSKPRVLMAHSKSSPLMVFRFSRWHLSLALRWRRGASGACCAGRYSCSTCTAGHDAVGSAEERGAQVRDDGSVAGNC